MKKQLLLCATLGMSIFNFAMYSQSVSIVKDLNTGEADGLDKWNSKAFAYNEMLLLPAASATTGTELYALKDGKVVLIKDINPGVEGSNPKNFTLYKNKVYFTATTVANGTEVWSTDGTEAGTQLALEAVAGASPTNSHDRFLVAKNGKLYFSQDGKAYMSDGTTAGTIRIGTFTNVNFSDDGTTESPASTTYKDGVAFVDNYRGDVMIYEHDGTSLKKLDSLDLDSFSNVYGLVEVTNGLVYATSDSFDDLLNGLFFISKSTGKVTEVKLASNSSIEVNRMLSVNGKAIFKTLSNGGIFSTDGTTAGTVKIALGNYTLSQLEPLPHAVVGNKIIFHGGGANTFKNDFYISDGTLAGTSIIATVTVPYFSQLVVSGDQVFWVAGIVNGFSPEMWSANLVQKTSKKLYTIPSPENMSTELTVLGVQNNALFLGGDLETFGMEIYKLNNLPVAIDDITLVQGNTEGLQLLSIDGGEKYFLKSDTKGITYHIEQYDLNGSVLRSIKVSDEQPFELQKNSKFSMLRVNSNTQINTFKIVNPQ